MRRRSHFLAEFWKALVFVLTLRAVAKPYRSRRIYLAER